MTNKKEHKCTNGSKKAINLSNTAEKSKKTREILPKTPRKGHEQPKNHKSRIPASFTNKTPTLRHHSDGNDAPLHGRQTGRDLVHRVDDGDQLGGHVSLHVPLRLHLARHTALQAGVGPRDGLKCGRQAREPRDHAAT